MRDTVLDIVLPVAALVAALLLFGLFVWLGGTSPVETWMLLFKGAFGDWFSWQNTLQRAAPLMLTALCVALPARAGLVIIGGEGALVLGGLAAAALPYAITLPGNVIGTAMVCLAGMAAGAASTKPSAVCCSPTSPSPFSNILSKVHCATRPASTSRRPARCPRAC